MDRKISKLMKINIQKDFYNHQWVIYYGDIKQTVDFLKVMII